MVDIILSGKCLWWREYIQKSFFFFFFRNSVSKGQHLSGKIKEGWTICPHLVKLNPNVGGPHSNLLINHVHVFDYAVKIIDFEWIDSVKLILLLRIFNLNFPIRFPFLKKLIKLWEFFFHPITNLFQYYAAYLMYLIEPASFVCACFILCLWFVNAFSSWTGQIRFLFW